MSAGDVQSSGSGTPEFHTTRWTVVLQAGDADRPAARQALEQLAQSYWYPLYAFLRRQGCDREEARDVTQGFFAHLLERGDLQKARPEGGRFRAFLLVSLKHYFLNERKKERALKRGGGHVQVPLDAGDAEPRFAREPFHEETPETAYEKHWARSVLDGALLRLEREWEASGKGERYRRFKDHLLENTGGADGLARELSMTEGAVRVALHRLRKHFARCLREEVADTVSDPSDVEDELRHLLDALT